MDVRWVLEQADVEMTSQLTAGYRYTTLSNQYADIKQRWPRIHSESKQAREEKTVQIRLSKATQAESKQLKKLKKQVFACQQDAQLASTWVY